MPITYQQTTDLEILDKVRQKHHSALHGLKLAGFEEYCFFAETVGMLGFSPLGLSGFLGMLIALFKEVAKVEGNLNVSVFNAVMVSKEHATYACPFGLGVKFYTRFTDGTCIISANFESPAINDENEKLYKFAASRTIGETWKSHRTWVEKLSAEGKQKSEPLSFAAYVKLAQSEDNYMLKRKNSIVAGDLGTTFLSIIISMSILVGVVYAFLLLASLLQALYPDCLIVSDKTPPIQMFLIALACVVVSWVLARFQKDMFTVNGVGTKLFGRAPAVDAKGYISTKWLALIIPLIPVRTYHIIGEHSNTPDKTFYSMLPLDQLNWRQIKETVREWWLGYLVTLLLLVGIITLPVWNCM